MNIMEIEKVSEYDSGKEACIAEDFTCFSCREIKRVLSCNSDNVYNCCVDLCLECIQKAFSDFEKK